MPEMINRNIFYLYEHKNFNPEIFNFRNIK